MTVIAMTREMGSLGKDVARLAAERLGLTIVHHEMIETAAERRAAEEPSAVARFLEAGSESPPGPAGLEHGGYLTPAEILALALRGDVLIRGWGASRLLRSIAHILTVRVCAPTERRVEEIRRRLGVDARTARREIDRSDAGHASAFLRFFTADWRSATNYDMVLNTGHLSVESCADILVDAARSATLAETPESRAALQDRLLEARVTERMQGSDGSLGRRAAYVRTSVDRGEVHLYGSVSDSATAREIEEIVRNVPGVAGVRSEMARVWMHGS